MKINAPNFKNHRVSVQSNGSEGLMLPLSARRAQEPKVLNAKDLEKAQGLNNRKYGLTRQKLSTQDSRGDLSARIR